MRNPAIVFNCSYNGLSILQELGSAGIECYAMDSGPSVGMVSRFASFRRCPNPSVREAEFIDFLYGFCRRFDTKPVLFPTNDHWAMAVARHKELLSEVSLPCVAPYSATSLTINKDQFYRLGQQRGYMTPRQWSVEELSALEQSCFPIVAKPRFRKTSGNGESARPRRDLLRLRLTVLRSQRELHAFMDRERTNLPDLIFQNYVAGMSDAMYTVGVYADGRSEFLGLFTGRKVRGYPADIGDNVVGESYRVPSALVENARRIAREIGLTGLAEFEYKRDEETHEYSLIEINPRAWSWIGITPACGVNLPLIAYRDLIGERVEPVQSLVPSGSVKYAKVLQDGLNCLVRYRFSHKAWGLSYRDWRASLEADTLVVAEYNRADWPVLLASVPYALARLMTGR